jgi:peptide deformylase
MPVKEILQLGHPNLWLPSTRVDNVGDSSVAATIADLGATLAELRSQHGFGRAITAPQIGVRSRVIFMDVGSPLAIINPEIVLRSSEMMELWDDCFSFPNLMVRVKRNAQITVEYTDERNSPRRIEARGDLSELLQHEIDHLDGILATDRAIDAGPSRPELKLNAPEAGWAPHNQLRNSQLMNRRLTLQ